MPFVALALGSNFGDRLAFLRSAVSVLSERGAIAVRRVSSVYRCPALLKEGAPKEWDREFYNAVLTAETALSPSALLGAVKQAERDIGRVDRGVWAPREIDIDILTYGEAVVSLPGLVVPHPRMTERSFVLEPLAEIAPDAVYPGAGEHGGRRYADVLREKGRDGTLEKAGVVL
jgi:2-amino-4-hydroxy-6-hydroxymethyldihydropteridine diphosphokinase